MTMHESGPLLPIEIDAEQAAPHLTLAHHHKAADGSEWLLNPKGYEQIVEPHAVDEYIAPFKADEKLGDVESFVAFVRRFGVEGTPPLLTWSTRGLRAVLDFGTMDAPGRGKALASHPFETTRQWQFWQGLADNRARSQKALIEALQERRQDVQSPDAAELVTMLRTLSATVNTSATFSLDEHGNSVLKYSREANTPLKLPPSITIGVPILKGHTAPDSQGIAGPVVYQLEVLIRVDIIDEGEKSRPTFRLTIPNAEQALEDAVADRVQAAKVLLGEGYTLLRAAS